MAQIWNVHLDHRDEDHRFLEAQKLAGMLGKNALIMGDFNSLSSADNYNPNLVAELQAKGIHKFGESTLRHDVMRYWVEEGLIDTAQLFGTNEWTVPTPANRDMNHADRLRLDYILATPSLLPNFVTVAAVKNPLTDKISDHYPMVATLK